MPLQDIQYAGQTFVLHQVNDTAQTYSLPYHQELQQICLPFAQYSEQATAARAVGNETLAKQYDELFKQTQSPGYRNYMLNNIIYGKQGTKLRSTSDMLLLNTQKSVARAIEKLNDNTMKLILKALS